MVKQRPGSAHCGLACLMMLMKYYNDKISYDEILKEVKVYKSGSTTRSPGMYTADFGKFTRQRGYKTFLNYYRPSILDKTTENLTDKDLLKLKKYLKEIKNKPRIKRQITKDIQYIEAGGKYSTKIPTLNLIDKYLKKKIPVMIALAMNSLRSNPNKKSNHFVVITGQEKNYYLINDPSTKFPRPYQLQNNKLLHSWYNAGAFLLVIYK